MLCDKRTRGSVVHPTKFFAMQKTLTGKEHLKMYYIYILESKRDNNLYVGYSNDLKRRFEEHNNGDVDATKNRRPFKLIYYEAFLNQQDATSREKFFKTGWGRTFLKKILKSYLIQGTLGLVVG